MSLTACRRFLVKSRNSLGGGIAVLLVGLVVVMAHSGLKAHDTGDHPAGMPEAVSMCLGIVQMGGGLLIVALLGAIRRGTPRFADLGPALRPVVPLFAERVPGNRIREGPAAQQVFRN